MEGRLNAPEAQQGLGRGTAARRRGVRVRAANRGIENKIPYFSRGDREEEAVVRGEKPTRRAGGRLHIRGLILGAGAGRQARFFGLAFTNRLSRATAIPDRVGRAADAGRLGHAGQQGQDDHQDVNESFHADVHFHMITPRGRSIQVCRGSGDRPFQVLGRRRRKVPRARIVSQS